MFVENLHNLLYDILFHRYHLSLFDELHSKLERGLAWKWKRSIAPMSSQLSFVSSLQVRTQLTRKLKQQK
jgi:hypothetical protein